MNISGLRRRAPAMQMIHDHLSGVFEHGCTTLESLLEGDALMAAICRHLSLHVGIIRRSA